MATATLAPLGGMFEQLYAQKRRLFEDGRQKPTLEGWPVFLDSALAWDGASSFSSEDAYMYTLNRQEILEIEAALAFFKDLGLDGKEACPANFPLPILGRSLQRLTQELHQGKGFFILRGLNPEAHTHEDNIIMFLGISSYVGEKRGKQDESGSMLMHICEAKKMMVEQEFRPARDSNTSLKFHSDLFCDILALQTIGCAAVAGDHVITSTYSIYNELAATRPDLLEALAKPEWNFDPRSLHTKLERRPLLFNHGGHIILNFGRNRILGQDDPGHRRINGIPAVTPLQMEALEMVQALGEKYQLKMVMHPGDLTFINNWGVLHSRDAFQDSESRTRYLVRMWIKNEELSWTLPRTLAAGNRKTYDDSAEEIWDILPVPRVKFNIRDRFSP